MARDGVSYSLRGLDDRISELTKFAKPNFLATAPLEAVLATGFGMTQGAVHVITGRLKASGYTESQFDGDVWEGSINYGGPAGTPAYYAIYEMSRPGTRPDGTPHDFFAVLDASYEQQVEDAFDQWFTKIMKGD